MAKKRKEFLLSEADYSYLEKVKEENNFKYMGEALSLIINEHKETTNQTVAEILIERITDNLKGELKKIRLSTNKTNRNSEVILEWLNGVSIKENYGPFYSREEKYHDGLKELEDIVDKKIEKQATKKWDSVY